MPGANVVKFNNTVFIATNAVAVRIIKQLLPNTDIINTIKYYHNYIHMYTDPS